MYLIIETFIDRKVPLCSLVLDARGNLLPDNQLIICQPVNSWTQIHISPPGSPPSSPRSISPSRDPEGRDLSHMMLVEDVTEHGLELDVVTAGCLFHLLARNQVYRQCFSKFWLKQRLSDLRLRIQLQESILKLIDYSGGQIANKVIWEYIELEDALHWLSTLGGAFSNLGEHHQGFAVKAGENALNQLRVAQRTGDKLIIAKCWLFVAMSQMQQGQYKIAKRIVRFVNNQAQTSGMRELVGTGKIITICRGIWNRLIYEIKQSRVELEVEVKFTVEQDCRATLIGLGAVNLEEVELQDIYLDKATLDFIGADSWLRFRDGRLELKSRDKDSDHQGTTTIYREDTDLEAISDRLAVSELPKSSTQLPQGWIILAQIHTHREQWKLGAISIVLDRLEDGYTIGEIELVVYHHNKVEGARARIDELAKELGCGRQVEGKLDHCLRVQHPAAYQILTELHRRNKKL